MRVVGLGTGTQTPTRCRLSPSKETSRYQIDNDSTLQFLARYKNVLVSRTTSVVNDQSSLLHYQGSCQATAATSNYGRAASCFGRNRRTKRKTNRKLGPKYGATSSKGKNQGTSKFYLISKTRVPLLLGGSFSITISPNLPHHTPPRRES